MTKYFLLRKMILPNCPRQSLNQQALNCGSCFTKLKQFLQNLQIFCQLLRFLTIGGRNEIILIMSVGIILFFARKLAADSNFILDTTLVHSNQQDGLE
jgi:hypothetical protein